MSREDEIIARAAAFVLCFGIAVLLLAGAGLYAIVRYLL
jgi:hypothetical protein